MEILTPENLIMSKVAKEATRKGLQEHAERLANQLEESLHQIDMIDQEIEALDELQIEHPDDPEPLDLSNPHAQPFLRGPEPVNLPGEQ